MTPRIQALIRALKLQPHPEGGWFAEVLRSAALVQPQDGRTPRSALTSIYFLLESAQQSRWHRVCSDEVWVHLEGDALALWCADADGQAATCTVLGPVDIDNDQRPQHTVRAGQWQAAKPVATALAGRGYTLVACLVGPGFDFADFSLLSEGCPQASALAAIDLGRQRP